jgi:hypothetical protein
MRRREETDEQAGIPVDAFGGKTIDPTKNVLDLVDAANRRQDDLRNAAVSTLTAELTGLREFFKEILTERDKRYEQRYKDIEAAFHAGLATQRDATAAAMLRQQEATNLALAAADRAVTKAETAAERRFDSVNEFRNTLSDQQRTLMPRAEAENRLGALSEKIGVLEGFRTETLSRGVGTKEGWGNAVGVVAFVISIVSLIGMAITLMVRFGGG